MPPVGFEPTISAGGRPQTYALDRAATAIGNATNTQSKYVIVIDFPPQQRLHERASVLRLFVHCLSYNTGLFKMIVGVLTTCHTQYTRDRGICILLFNRTTLQVFVTYLTGALYVHPL